MSKELSRFLPARPHRDQTARPPLERQLRSRDLREGAIPQEGMEADEPGPDAGPTQQGKGAYWSQGSPKRGGPGIRRLGENPLKEGSGTGALKNRIGAGPGIRKRESVRSGPSPSGNVRAWQGTGLRGKGSCPERERAERIRDRPSFRGGQGHWHPWPGDRPSAGREDLLRPGLAQASKELLYFRDSGDGLRQDGQGGRISLLLKPPSPSGRGPGPGHLPLRDAMRERKDRSPDLRKDARASSGRSFRHYPNGQDARVEEGPGQGKPKGQAPGLPQ